MFSLTILFDDHTTAVMPAGDVFMQKHFHKGQQVRVRLKDGYYHDGVIMHSLRYLL